MSVYIRRCIYIYAKLITDKENMRRLLIDLASWVLKLRKRDSMETFINPNRMLAEMLITIAKTYISHIIVCEIAIGCSNTDNKRMM